MSICSIIAAVAENRVIGHKNALPWHLPEDLQHFRALTMGHVIVMGRKTWESLGRLLPGRTHVIVSRNPDYQVTGARVVSSLAEAKAQCDDVPEFFVIGGAGLYQEAIVMADRLYLTEIEESFAGDVFFPEYDRRAWRETERIETVSAEGLRYAYVTYLRR